MAGGEAAVNNGAALELAVRVGVCVDEGSPAGALAAVRAYMGADMAQLDSWDRVRAASLSVQGCPRDVARVLSEELPSDPVFGARLLETRSVCLDGDFGFLRSAYYRDCFRPAGAAAGLSVALGDGSGQVVGLLHLAGPRPGHFGEKHRAVLDALAPLLARAAVTPCPLTASLPPSYAVSVLRGGRAEPVRGREAAVVAADPGLCSVVSRLAGPSLRFLWPLRGRWFEVRATSVQEGAVAVACRPVDLPYGLTPRELEVLTALSGGATNRQIASGLGISERTVTTHVEHVLAKLGAPGRTSAAVRAVREGLLLPTADPGSLRCVERLLGDGVSVHG